MKFYRRKKIY